MSALAGSQLDGYLLSEEVAPKLGVAASTLNEWCRRGRIPCRRLPGTRRFLIPSDELDALLNGAELETKHGPDGGLIVAPKKKGTR